jgi:16S rRNA (guanine(966)-N(2))-methyltransferase RsmD
MRVIAGTARGCALAAPKGWATRPTADRLKENLFNLLAPFLPDACFLDLFSGSGAIGIEALSRGARDAVFVESSPQAAEAIRANLRKTRLASRAALYVMSAARAMRLLARDERAFDIIFLDPPYASSAMVETLPYLASCRLLSNGGVLAAELPAGAAPPLVSTWALDKTKIYGNTQFAFYTYAEGSVMNTL